MIKSAVVAITLLFAGLAQAANPQLDQLFGLLQDAETPKEARLIEREIWAIWLDYPGSETEDFQRLVRAVGQGDTATGIPLASELIEAEPEFAETWNKRATLHFINRDFEASIADIGQTLLLEPRHFGALFGLASIFERQERFADALRVIEELKVISPQSPNLTVWEARLKEKLAESAS